MTALPIISGESIIPPSGGASGKAHNASSTRQARRSEKDAAPDAPTGADQKSEAAGQSDQAGRPPARQGGNGSADGGASRAKGRRTGRKKLRTKCAPQPNVANALAPSDVETPPPAFAEVIRRLALPQDGTDGLKPHAGTKAPAARRPDKGAPLGIKGPEAKGPLAHPIQAAPQAKPDVAAGAKQAAAPQLAAGQAAHKHHALPQPEALGTETPAQAAPGTESQPGARATAAGASDLATAPVAVAPPETAEVSAPGTGETSPADLGRADQNTPQATEGEKTTFESVRPRSRVGAEISSRADSNVTEAGQAVVQPAQPRSSSQHVAGDRPAGPAVEPAVEPAQPAQPAAQTDQPQALGNAAAAATTGAGQVESASQAEHQPQVASATRPTWPDSVEQVSEQILLVRPQAGQRVVVRLNPPELGHVRLTLRGGRGGIRGTIEVDSARTLAELQNAVPPMIERLAAGGIELRQLTLVLSRQNENGTGGEGSGSTLHDSALAQQQQGRGAWAQHGRGGLSDASGAPDEAEGARGAPTYVSDDSINVWI